MRFRGRVIAAAALLTVGLSGCGGVQDRAAPESSSTSKAALPSASGSECATVAGDDLESFADQKLSEAVAKMPGVTTYSGYLTANAERAKSLDSASDVTVFIPADTAYAALDADTAAKLADPAWTLALLEYSVVPELVLPDQLQSGEAAELPTVRSESAQLAAVLIDGQVKLNGAAGMLCSSIAFAGGLIYVVDRVLLPAA